MDDIRDPNRRRSLFGHRLKSIREAKRLTQEELANRIGCKAVTISRWERGEREPNAGNLANLAAALEVDLTSLIGDGDDASSLDAKAASSAPPRYPSGIEGRLAALRDRHDPADVQSLFYEEINILTEAAQKLSRGAVYMNDTQLDVIIGMVDDLSSSLRDIKKERDSVSSSVVGG